MASCLVIALHDIHHNGIILNDLKPDNIVLDEFGYPYLIDFGSAIYWNQSEDNNICIQGTYEYIAPEWI